jgi:hypothetical protein
MSILTAKQVWRRNPEPEPRQLGNRLGHVEREHVRQAAIYLVGRYATIDACAAALGITHEAVKKSRRRARCTARRPTASRASSRGARAYR